MRTLALTLALLTIVGLALPAEAKQLTHKKGGVVIDLPDKWSAKDEGSDGTLVVEAPNGELAFTFSVVDGEDLEAVLKETLEAVEKEVGTLEGEDPEDVKVNGMEGFVCEGRTKDNLIVTILCLITPKNKALTIFSASTEASEKKYEKEINRICRGLKPL